MPPGDDDWLLPESPSEEEARLAVQLGEEGLRAIDDVLCKHAGARWLKVARLVIDALEAGGVPAVSEAHADLHARRVIGLVQTGALEGKGNLRRPRWSEVRLRGTS